MWRLEFLETGVWKHLSEAPTGDAAKTQARRHAIGLGGLVSYRILSPDGQVWVYGSPTHNRRGLRMSWSWEGL